MSDEYNEDDGPDFDLDFGNVKEFKPVEDGDYICTVSDAQIKPTKDKTGYNFVINLEVNEPAEENGASIRSVINYYAPNPFSVFNMLKAVLDMETEDLKTYAGGARALAKELPGNTVGVTVTKEWFEDHWTNKVKSWWVPGKKDISSDFPPMYEDGEEPF